MSNALRNAYVAALLGALLLVPTMGVCAPPETGITSDRLQQRDGKYLFEGSVSITREDFTLWSESMVYDKSGSTVEAKGSVIINSPDFEARGDRAIMNLQTNTGVLYGADAHYFDGDYYVKAEELSILGDGQYFLRQASITTCTDLPPAWCIRGSKVDILVGERVKATHARFKLKNIPVLYTPYLWLPIITERRTGFLPPTLGFRNSTGLHIEQPFFWAMSANRDATFTLDYHTKEAFGQEIEYRYIEAPHITGQWNVMHLRDTEHGYDYIETLIRHRHDGEAVAGFFNLHTINRDDYYRLYEDYLEDSSLRYLESTAEVFHLVPPEDHFGNSRFYVSTRHYQDLMEDVESESVLQWRPETGLSIAPLGPGPLNLFGRARAVGFEREVGQEGRRAELEARASLTAGSALVLRQEAGATRVFYETHDEDTPEERTSLEVYDYRADLGFSASRPYGSVTHQIEPYLIFNRTVMTNTPVASFDLTDTETERSLGTFQLTNRLRSPKGNFLSLVLSQSYDFLADEKPYKPLAGNLSLRQPTGPFSVSVALKYNHYDEQISSMSSQMKLDFKRFDFALGQQYNRQGEIETYSGDADLKVTSKLNLFTGLRYDETEEKGLEEVKAGFKYLSQCWGMMITYVEKPDDYAITLQFSLLGLGEMGYN